MTQEQLSDAIHVARTTISNWERGQRQPDLDSLRLLEQVLHTTFRSGEAGIPEDTDAGGQTADSQTDKPETAQAPKETSQRRRRLVIAAVLGAIVLCAGVILAMTLLNRPAGSAPASAGTQYAIADYDQTTKNEAGKAYLTIIKTLSVRPGDGKDYYAINFSLREDNGIALTIGRLEMIVFFTDHADAHIFSHDELAGAGFEPDMPAYGFLSIDNGFPTDQIGLQGMGIRILGTDANGADLTFTSYLPIP